MAAKSKLFAKFATDQDKEETGVWVDFGDDLKVKVRRLRSRKSIEVRKELDKPHVNEIRRGVMSPDVAEELLMRQVAGGVIADWKGVEDEDGTVLPYTPDNAYKLLKALPEFRDAIFQVSMDADAFKASDTEDAKGNSQPS